MAGCLRGPAALCVALTAVSAIAPPASITFHCDAAESANAVYHVACLAGQVPCTKDAFERFWHDTLRWTPDDQRELDAWTETLTNVERAAGPAPAAPYAGNYRSFFPGVDARLTIIHAAIESTSLADFQRRIRRWLTADDGARLQQAIVHFRGRLRPWWRKSGAEAVKARVRDAEKRLRGSAMVALAGEVAAFVEAESPARDIYVHVVAAPEAKSDAASATFVSNHCFVEVTDAMAADGIASVSMHELTHYLYETAQGRRHDELMQQFVRAQVPDASAFYGLLNEALASAVQGVLRDRSGGSKESTSGRDEYRHAFISRLGRSTVPVLEDALSSRSTLYQGFSQAYLRAAIRELGPDVTDPRFFLTSAAILPSDKAARAYAIFLEAFQPVSVVKSDDWRRFPDLNVVFLLAYDELEAFARAFPDLSKHTGRRGFAYMGPRGERAKICILAGADEGAIVDVVKAFAKQQSVSSSGLLLAID
jgi:hypothetical protein